MTDLTEERLIYFKKEIYSLRKANRMTQKDVARYLGIAPQSYQAYESGEALPGLRNFLKLAELFDVTPDELLGCERF